MSVLDKVWHVYVGQSWVGTLTPTGADGSWYYADFSPGDAWGNFAPWFIKAAEAFNAGDEAGWQSVYDQLMLMGVTLVADDGESYHNPIMIMDGNSVRFAV